MTDYMTKKADEAKEMAFLSLFVRRVERTIEKQILVHVYLCRRTTV
jgi:hypothetical protein